MIEAFWGIFAVFGYAAISFVLPVLYAQYRLRRHYREWIVSSNAYWQRAYYKWIIGHRIFYTDEFSGDVWLAVLVGPFCGMMGALLFSNHIELEAPTAFLLTSMGATPVFLFVITVWERVRLIDAELALRGLVDQSFDNEARIRILLEGDRRYIRKVLLRPVSRE